MKNEDEEPGYEPYNCNWGHQEFPIKLKKSLVLHQTGDPKYEGRMDHHVKANSLPSVFRFFRVEHGVIEGAVQRDQIQQPNTQTYPGHVTNIEDKYDAK